VQNIFIQVIFNQPGLSLDVHGHHREHNLCHLCQEASNIFFFGLIENRTKIPAP